MKEIKTVEAVGHVLCHDMTQIIVGVTKDARFRKGHIVTEEDVPILLSMGKETLFVWEKTEGMLHEDEAAEYLRRISQGENMHATAPKEGKIELVADCDGLLRVDVQKLEEINLIDEIMIAVRRTNTPVHKGDKLAGMRVIPLVIKESKLRYAEKLAGEEPILQIIPYKLKTAAVITTGNEVKNGTIRDTFTPVLIKKLSEYGIKVIHHCLSGDDSEFIKNAALEYHSAGIDIILCTGGMSVDADDRTPKAIRDTGAEIITYGAPVLPGAMLMLGYFSDGVPIIGLPGCVMYSKATVFDLILPQIAAGVKISKKDLIKLGHGGLCLNCDICRFPDCGFGKG